MAIGHNFQLYRTATSLFLSPFVCACVPLSCLAQTVSMSNDFTASQEARIEELIQASIMRHVQPLQTRVNEVCALSVACVLCGHASHSVSTKNPTSTQLTNSSLPLFEL